jgi:hypothetical protein
MQNTANWLTVETLESGEHELLTSATFGPRAILFARLNNGNFAIGFADHEHGRFTRITRSVYVREHEVQGLLSTMHEAARLFHEGGDQ